MLRSMWDARLLVAIPRVWTEGRCDERSWPSLRCSQRKKNLGYISHAVEVSCVFVRARHAPARTYTRVLCFLSHEEHQHEPCPCLPHLRFSRRASSLLFFRVSLSLNCLPEERRWAVPFALAWHPTHPLMSPIISRHFARTMQKTSKWEGAIKLLMLFKSTYLEVRFTVIVYNFCNSNITIWNTI